MKLKEWGRRISSSLDFTIVFYIDKNEIEMSSYQEHWEYIYFSYKKPSCTDDNLSFWKPLLNYLQKEVIKNEAK